MVESKHEGFTMSHLVNAFWVGEEKPLLPVQIVSQLQHEAGSHGKSSYCSHTREYEVKFLLPDGFSLHLRHTNPDSLLESIPSWRIFVENQWG